MFKFVNKLKNRKGFTLIELLVVLAVLAIIALIAVPRFTGIKENAKLKSDYASARTIKRSLELAIAAGDFEKKSTADADENLICTFNGSGVNVDDTDSTCTLAILQKYVDTTVKVQNTTAGKTVFTFSFGTNGTVDVSPALPTE